MRRHRLILFQPSFSNCHSTLNRHERVAALFSLSMGVLGQGAVTRGYLSIRAGRGTFQSINSSVTQEEIALENWPLIILVPILWLKLPNALAALALRITELSSKGKRLNSRT